MYETIKMFFLCKHTGNEKFYLTVKNYPHVDFQIHSVDRDRTEVFKLLELDGRTIMSSCTTPTLYVASGCTSFTTDPFDTHDFTSSLDLNSNVCVLEHIVHKECNLSACAMELERNGYTIIPDVLNNEQIQIALDALDLGKDLGKKQVRRGDLIERHAIFRDMLTMDPIWTLLSCFMKNDIKCATWSSNTLMGGSADTGTQQPLWHVDYPYHNIPPTCWGHPHDPLSMQTVWILDDFRYENGATLVIPGSHKYKTVPTIDNTNGKHVMPLVCSKGSVVVSHGAWWHSQGVNKTQFPRSCLLGTFTKRWIVSKDDLNGQFEKLDDADKSNMVRSVLGI
jgi:fumagillin biosynthesis dioxygenase